MRKLIFNFTNEGESDFPAMGAFRVGSAHSGNPLIRFNLEAIMYAIKDDERKSDSLKECLLQVLGHEMLHAFQEYLDMELDEAIVDKILESYNSDWVSRDKAPESIDISIPSDEVIQLLEHLMSVDDISDLKEQLANQLLSIKSFSYTGK
jgi:hypothetical protein